MVAPVANKITLPSDTGNAGKNVRTQTRVVGADTVHEHYFIPISANEAIGKYFFSSTQQTVSPTAQNATGTGFFWLQIPSGATVTAAISRIACDAAAATALVTASAPRISFAKFTFSGSAGGASVTPVPYKTGLSANQMIVRTAVSGMTVTVVGDVGSFAIPTVNTAVGQVYAQKEVLSRNPLSFARGYELEIGPGEGLVVYQTTAGTTSDTRTFGVQIEWSEMDLST